ncbi:MAG: patatin-like phospholipase family protein [Burkholderiales bacterium]
MAKTRVHAARTPPDEGKYELTAVVERERELLARTGAPAGAPIGLAFSGGGIRSATFNLGIIQALADCRLLSRFHYLSTVSGGGYIGSWLSALIHRSGEGRVERIESALAATPENFQERAARCDLPGEALARLAEEASYAIQYLRRYASYLTPRTGVFGLDTLTGIVIYLRNLQLNFGILFLSSIALLLVPYLAADLAGIVEGSLALAVLLVAACAFFIGLGMGEPLKGGLDRVAPWSACVAALLGCLVAADWLASPIVPVLLEDGPANWIVVAAFINVVFWAIAGLGRALRLRLRRLAWEQDDAGGLGSRGATFFIGAVFAGGIVGLAFYGFARVGTCLSLGACGIESVERALSGFRDLFVEAAGDQFLLWISIEIFAPLLALMASTAVVLQIGIAKRGFSEHDREWLGRLGALLLKCCLAWVAAVGIVMLAPPLMKAAGAWLYSGGAAWLVTTLAGLFAAKSRHSGGLDGVWKDRLLAVVPWVFVLGLLFLLAACLHLLLTAPFDTSACKDFAEAADRSRSFLRHAALDLCEISRTFIDLPGLSGIGQLHLALFASALAAAYLLGWRFDINLFAYHQFYRNRLARCFLGASKYARGNETPALQRHPNEFTDLDPDDDLRLHDLALERAEGRVQHPYHLVNTALNLANPKDLGWQQRKAASFTFSPLFAGYELRYERSRRGGYRSMEIYGGGGMKLGIPLAISGAAASPNQGYHTSPGLAFLMTVFNVRLGRWCGNTASRRAWRDPGPVFSNHYLFRELLADTNEASRFLYLSDGGHFENLGVYELVRRRCAVIVACDAGCDPKYDFEDLGNAILKCETDLGVEIDIEVDALRPKEANGPCKAHFAVGTIKYPGIERLGTLIYIKNSMSGGEPVDIQHYQSKHPEFPHQSTADQWFDEPQFESYRRLGRHIGLDVFERIAGVEDVGAEALQERYPPTGGRARDGQKTGSS